MKTYKFFAALMLGAAVVACKGGEATTEPVEGEEAAAEAVKEKTAKDYLPTKSEVNEVSYLIGVNFGSFIKNYNFGDVNYSEMLKGIKDFIKAEGDMRSEDFGKQFKVDPNQLNQIFNAYLEKRQNYTALINKEAETEFLAKNGKKAGVQTSESGLQYEVIEAGCDTIAGPTDTVWVRYKGTLLDGTTFDEVAEDAEPVHFTLNQVVKGWQEGLQLVGQGGHIKLYVPSALGYGEQANQAIPANSTLIFDVKLIKVGKVPAAEEVAE